MSYFRGNKNHPSPRKTRAAAFYSRKFRLILGPKALLLGIQGMTAAEQELGAELRDSLCTTKVLKKMRVTAKNYSKNSLLRGGFRAIIRTHTVEI